MGITLCNEADIKARLQLGDADSLTADQSKKWPPLAEEATGIVEGFIHRAWGTDPGISSVPQGIRVVTSRMTVRAMGAATSPNTPVEGQEAASSTFGPMSYNNRFGTDAVFTSPWLSKADRLALQPYVDRGSVVHEPMFDTDYVSNLDNDWRG